MFRYLLVFAGFLLTGCTIEQQYEFEEDFSGKYGLQIDLSSVYALMGDSAESASPLAEVNVDSMIMELNKLEGISGAMISEKEGMLDLTYQFSSMETLNKTMVDQNMNNLINDSASMKQSSPQFSKKGKSIYYHWEGFDKATVDSWEEFKGMEEMIRYKLTMRFPRPIKKIDNKSATLSADNKTLTIEGSLMDFIQNKIDLNMKVKL